MANQEELKKSAEELRNSSEPDAEAKLKSTEGRIALSAKEVKEYECMLKAPGCSKQMFTEMIPVFGPVKAMSDKEFDEHSKIVLDTLIEDLQKKYSREELQGTYLPNLAAKVHNQLEN